MPKQLFLLGMHELVPQSADSFDCLSTSACALRMSMIGALLSDDCVLGRWGRCSFVTAVGGDE